MPLIWLDPTEHWLLDLIANLEQIPCKRLAEPSEQHPVIKLAQMDTMTAKHWLLSCQFTHRGLPMPHWPEASQQHMHMALLYIGQAWSSDTKG